MSKTNVKTNTKANAKTAKSCPLLKNPQLLPMVILLIGLIIMMVCFFNVNGKLSTATSAAQSLAAQVETLTAEKTALNEKLDAANEAVATANATLAEKEAALTDAQSRLDAAEVALTNLLQSVQQMLGEVPAE
ncbi:MAG: hypothetical protein IJZ74_05775 [Clostridia bacterium]|nr:hypothetical protein [Clostridia bacterium]